MSVLLLDVWHDLREKRLVPVAAALLVALIAIPLLLLKPADEFEGPPVIPPTADAAVKTTAGGGKALVALAVLADKSKLDVFDTKNPFKPLKKVGSLSGDSGDSGTPDGAAAAAAAGGEAAVGADGVGQSETGGNQTTGSDTETGGETDGGSGGDDTATTAYTYNVDVSFGERGDEQEVEGLDRLEMLPDENDPLLVFLGMDSDVKNAVFLVDSSLAQSGEGECKPDDETCSFLYLSLDGNENEHNFTDDAGTEYGLKLLKVNKVSVDDGGEENGAEGSSASSGFSFPLFSDVVTTR